MKNTKKIPTLRFPEFSGEWEVKKMQDVTKINQGLQIEISERFTHQVENSYFYITNEFLKNGSKKKFFIKNPPASVLCNKDDILMTRTGNTGMVVTNVEGAFHNNFFKIKYDIERINKNFYYYFLNLKKTKNLILKLAGTSTIPDLNHGDFYKIKICFPAIQEQQKIADFLTQIDNRIEKLTKKKELLEKYKKGVMQKIFNQEIRFKNDNGEDYPDWEYKNLGEMSNPKQWATISSNDLLDSGYPVYGANSFIGYYSEYNHEFETVTITCRGATCGSVSLIPEKSYITGNSMCLDDIDPTIYNYKFIYYSISFRGFDDVISGSAQPQIIGSAIRKVKIKVPCLEEQQKIANFLTEIDKKINLTEKQLNGTKQYKKGLLQQMFI